MDNPSSLALQKVKNPLGMTFGWSSAEFHCPGANLDGSSEAGLGRQRGRLASLRS